MSTDQGGAAPEQAPETAPAQDPETTRPPDWWHRDHPTFTALTGFFSGLALVIVVPGLFIAILNLIFDYDTAENLFPFVLVVLAIPIGLLIAPRTRRFGTYLLIGMFSTLLVVGAVASVVLWYMITYHG